MGTGGEGTYTIGQMGGVESVTLTTQQIPIHTHQLIASGESGSTSNPGGAMVAVGPTVYRPAPAVAAMNAGSITPQGGSQPHENMQPFLCINYIISLFGIFPSPT
jgi:microcystin-dependent protein